jgi:hypothetical protein
MMTNFDRAPMQSPTTKAGRLLMVALLAMLVVACGNSDQSLTAPAAVFEETACQVPLPTGQTADLMRCGVVTVPEDRNQPGARVVRLPVVVLMATGATPSEDPVVFLQGGPGGPLDPLLRIFTASFAAPIQEKRDIVFFDQRGAGRSEPSLDCPEWRTAFTAGLDESLTAEQDAATYLAAHEVCHQRLLDEGADPGAYTSAASASTPPSLCRSTPPRSSRPVFSARSIRCSLAVPPIPTAPAHTRTSSRHCSRSPIGSMWSRSDWRPPTRSRASQ